MGSNRENVMRHLKLSKALTASAAVTLVWVGISACSGSTPRSDAKENWVITHTSYIGAAAVNASSIHPNGKLVAFTLAAYEQPESDAPPRSIPGGQTGPVGVIEAVVDCDSKVTTVTAMSFINELGEATAILPEGEVSRMGPMLKGGGDQPYDTAVDMVCADAGRRQLAASKGSQRKELLQALRDAVDAYEG